MERVYHFQDVQHEAGRIVAAARAQARAVLEEAARRIAEVRRAALEEARAQGHAEGLAQGRRDAGEQFRQETSTVVSALQAVADSWEAAQREFLERAEHDAALLAMAIAERIVLRELETDRQAIVRIARRAIELATDRHRIEIRLHPRDRAALEAALPDLKARFLEIQSVTLTEDPTITPGGAVVHTETGQVDAQVETMLEEIRAALFGGGEQPGAAGA